MEVEGIADLRLVHNMTLAERIAASRLFEMLWKRNVMLKYYSCIADVASLRPAKL